MIEPRRYLHQAAYVLTMSPDSVLPTMLFDGAVLTEDGVIREVGPYSRLLRHSDAVLVEHTDALLMPAMVNCHSHLELSCLANLGQQRPVHGGITGWIRELLKNRETITDPEEITMAAWQALANLYGSGCRGLVDIGNRAESRDIGKDFKIAVHFFQEFLGLVDATAGLIKERITQLDTDHACTGHALYSTGPKLLRFLKDRSRNFGQLFPLHVAESMDEIEFLATGQGPFRNFLEERQIWDDTFIVSGKSPVAHLDDLGILDDRTLCVHGIHLTDGDFDLLSTRQTPVCVCPGSNRFLDVGIAPVARMIDRGLTVVLGTDSLASNPQLNLWCEMQILAEDHPGLDPRAIVRMSTLNGARIMGLEDQIGSIAPGLSANFLAVRGDMPKGGDEESVYSWLVGSGLEIKCEWVEI
ncbi:MAG: amidohydrolase family protein [Proteobacteria bacterium]|nr:amidohydrolase family protein [Pseudomonadota bacterium]MBU1686545.1 amidohydrolase family protein [Pseudomonadota bacterium]